LRLGLSQERGRLAILRLVLLHVLVGNVDLTLQLVELRILEYLPPITPVLRVLRGAELPPRRQLLVRSGHRGWRPVIVGSDRAGGERERQRGRGRRAVS